MSHSTADSRPAAPSTDGKPTLEMLLRLKRAERPDAAFWEEFDRGLRQKQLAAIIEPKPWWLGLALLGRRLTPVGLPVSAAAAALFAVMVVRTQTPFTASTDSRPVEFGPMQAARVEHASTPSVAPASAVAPLVASSASSSIPAPAPVAIAEVAPVASSLAVESHAEIGPASLSAPLPAASSAASRHSEPEAPLVASLLQITAPSAPASPTPSQLTIAQNLAVVRAEEPELLSGSAGLAAAPDLAEEAVIDPAALKMEVRNPRHARVLLAMADNPEVESVGGGPRLRDRLVRSLDDSDALSGSSRRFVGGGDRLSLSF